MKKRVIGVALVACASMLLGVAGASAVPTPDSGPTAGGTTVTVELPDAPVGYRQVSHGSATSIAIGNNGKTYAWGQNTSGQLGNGTTTDSSSPVEVTMPAGVTFDYVDAGGAHAIALGSDGNAYAWGQNASGQGGNGTADTTLLTVPTLVQAPSGVKFTSVAAGAFHNLAIGDDGNTYAWGQNNNGQIGNGTDAVSAPINPLPLPVSMPAGVVFTEVHAGFYHSLAVTSDGDLYTWGSNGAGELGNSTIGGNSTVPVKVQVPAGVHLSDVSVGRTINVAQGSDGNTYAWGSNMYGEIGVGTTGGGFAVPTAVHAPTGVTFSKVETGYSHMIALGSDGNTYAWGRNVSGALGNGLTTSSNVPVQAVPPAGVSYTAVSGGAEVSFAVGNDGHYYAWGANGSGRLGDGTTASSLTPVRVIEPAIEQVTLSAVTFGGVAADPASFTEVSPGQWTVTTPAHAAGTVDVVIDWTLGTTAQTPITHAGGFTFIAPDAAPTIVTDPASTTVSAGETATFTVEVAGSPTPGVAWQVSKDNGTTWDAIAADAGATVAADGLSVSVVGTATNTGLRYRAVATNTVGEATSAAATLTVNLATNIAPTFITNPKDATVRQGDTATFTVKAQGEPAPAVTWEVSNDGGASWTAAKSQDALALVVSDSSISIIGSAQNNGYQYRATATNTEGTAVSMVATLTTLEDPACEGDSCEKPGTTTPTPPLKDTATLAVTGNNDIISWVSLAAGLVLLVAGGSVLFIRRFGITTRL